MSCNTFEGACGQIFDEASQDSYIPCICGQQDCLAAWSPQPIRSRARNQQLQAFVYFENVNGHKIVAPDKEAQPPNGYTRREVNTFVEMRKLETIFTRQELDIRERFTEHEQAQREHMIAEQRKE